MSQIVGYKRLSDGLDYTIPSTAASVDKTDHKSNGALCVSTYDGPAGMIVEVDGDTTSTGWCAPGHTDDTDEAIWRIRKVVVNGDITTTYWACKPAAGGVPAKNAGFDHIWDDKAGLTYK